MKECMMCHQVLSFENFNKNKHNKSGYASYCKPCYKEYSKSHYEKTYVRKHAKEKIINNTRCCSQCKEYKPFSEFKNEKYSWCQLCQKEYDRKRNEHKLVHPVKEKNGLQHCRKCNEYLDKKEFWSNNTYCRTCTDLIGHIGNLKKYGLSKDDYVDMELSQNGKCAICKKPETLRKRLSVDHDHSCCPGERACGKCNRGLLCSSCNKMLGMVNDDIEILKSAITYLEK